MGDLAKKTCRPCEGGIEALNETAVAALLTELPGWSLHDGRLTRSFPFKNFHETMAFVNAMAWIAHQEDHHPDFEVGYRTCVVHYITHAIGGLSENDFICAAKISALID